MPFTFPILADLKALPQTFRLRRRCKTCNNFNAAGHPKANSYEEFEIQYGDIQENCRFCQLLKLMVAHFGETDPETLILFTSEKGKPVKIMYRNQFYSNGGSNNIQYRRWIEFAIYIPTPVKQDASNSLWSNLLSD